MLAAVELYQVTDLVLVPALALSLMRYPGTRTFDLSSVEIVRTMSAPVAPVTLEKLDKVFENAAIVNMYTTTEAWPARTRIRYSPDHPNSVGRAGMSGSVRVVDSAGRPVDAGSTGYVELALDGAPRRRYLDGSGQSQQVFRADGWVRTGDTGYLDREGYLYLVDRNADLVITGGLNVSTIEVEAAMLEFPSIVAVAVFGLPHPTLGEYLAAAVQTTDGFSHSELGTFLERRLGPAKAPKRVDVLDQLPHNPMGKVLKNELRELALSRVDDGGSEPQASGLEMHLRNLWSDAIGEEVVDRKVRFVDLGGTSLGALDLVARVRSEVGREISQRDVFEAIGVVEFAARVEAAPASTTRHHREVRPAARTKRLGDAWLLPTKYSQDLHYDATGSGWSDLTVPLVIPLEPHYDRSVLQLALDDLVERHEALRTTLARVAGTIVQQVHMKGTLRLETADVDATAIAAEHASRTVDVAAYEPFEVRGGWLARARICHIDAELDVLVLSTHHAVCDGWSAGILYRDLAELYRARSEGRAPKLPRLTLQVGDYARWERSVIRRGPSEYWRAHLDGANPLLELEGLGESAHAPGRMQVFPVAEVSPAMTRRLDGLAAVHETTRARILAAIVIASVRDYLRARATIGFVTANRDRPELLSVVGDLADLVPVRVELADNPSFGELLARFDRALDDAYQHRLPYGVLEGLLREGPDRATASALDITVNYVPAAGRLAARNDEARRLVRDEVLPWKLRAPVFEIDDWWKIGGLLNYTFSATGDGGIDTGIFANVTAVSEQQVLELGKRLTSSIDQIASTRSGCRD
ncbi:acyl carrier protein [Kribbella aluminosa]|uniref:Acyl carrier protein n=1 Tax=Kribbella aluminosa TaxID=416017 RepID=A0ABS4UDD0_9ACTN|nr:condensation domain-containing protein [Kribbella aluminosa]MBP2349649.1 acyl carrier protein [Kribbella aluminosa]